MKRKKRLTSMSDLHTCNFDYCSLKPMNEKTYCELHIHQCNGEKQGVKFCTFTISDSGKKCRIAITNKNCQFCMIHEYETGINLKDQEKTTNFAIVNEKSLDSSKMTDLNLFPDLSENLNFQLINQISSFSGNGDRNHNRSDLDLLKNFENHNFLLDYKQGFYDAMSNSCEDSDFFKPNFANNLTFDQFENNLKYCEIHPLENQKTLSNTEVSDLLLSLYKNLDQVFKDLKYNESVIMKIQKTRLNKKIDILSKSECTINKLINQDNEKLIQSHVDHFFVPNKNDSKIDLPNTCKFVDTFKCTQNVLPLSGYCFQHILNEPEQTLFQKCMTIDCNYPTIEVMYGPHCKKHAKIDKP
ncbi:hypothetical protein A3Q56_05405 [Intoshia linei]|uniref:KAT8 regulatory NSL complex subunit 2 n=1 Tax=Intoshia linei TaxID=1819745 RepID=A0A177B0A9_9BILA|nr:hypothetical protein A3Q56_05405 [Intoshia linei]